MTEAMDRTLARLLRVPLQPDGPRAVAATTSSRPFETPLLLSAARCVLRYLVLPFILPLGGIATGAALAVILPLDLVATVAIVATLRRLWRLRHPRRWQYLALAVVMGALIGLFFVTDVRALRA